MSAAVASQEEDEVQGRYGVYSTRAISHSKYFSEMAWLFELQGKSWCMSSEVFARLLSHIRPAAPG